jgi:hypothetical protein
MSLLRLLQGSLAWIGSPRLNADLRETIAWAVDLVEPRLRQAGGYPRRYAGPLAHAMAYCRDLAARVPGPVAVNRHAFTQDFLVHTLFASPQGIVQALARSKAVREWQRHHRDGEQVFALLGFRRQEKGILGMEVQGEKLQRDVSQQVVYFSDHTFSEAAESETAARALLQRHFLESLLLRIGKHIAAIRDQKRTLEIRRDEARAQLRVHQDDAAAQAELATTLAALGETVSALDLHACAAHFDAVLLHPEQYLRLDARTFCLDAMGVRRADESHGGQCVELQEMTCRDQRRWGVLLAQVRLDEVPHYQDRLDAAARWLEI